MVLLISPNMLNKTHGFATSTAPQTMSAAVLQAPTLFWGMWGWCLIGDEKTEGRPRQGKPMRYVVSNSFVLFSWISYLPFPPQYGFAMSPAPRTMSATALRAPTLFRLTITACLYYRSLRGNRGETQTRETHEACRFEFFCFVLLDLLLTLPTTVWNSPCHLPLERCLPLRCEPLPSFDHSMSILQVPQLPK
jgi:hypothetical protein